jgi:DNA repair exonuclease SbcCD ATPase subunit
MTSEAIGPHDELKLPPRDGSAAHPRAAAGGPADVLRLQPRLVPRADGLYYVSEILAYHDEAFVEAAFASVLRRPPADEEFRQTLADLRNGAREKIDILRDLARSAEGKSLSAFERIAGLRRSRLAEFARSLPVVGPLWQILTAIVRLPVALRHQRQFEAYALAQQQRIADHFNARLSDEALADASGAVSLLSDAMAEMAARHGEQLSQLARQLERAAARLDEVGRGLEEAGRLGAEHAARLEAHGAQLGEHGRRFEEHGRRIDAQQEFLIREQQAIVEAQKAALADAGEELGAAVSEQRRELAALSARVDELRAALDAERASAGGKP